jgi:hypothetical protein
LSEIYQGNFDHKGPKEKEELIKEVRGAASPPEICA